MGEEEAAGGRVAKPRPAWLNSTRAARDWRANFFPVGIAHSVVVGTTWGADAVAGGAAGGVGHVEQARESRRQMKVIALNITLSELNPNHRYRMALSLWPPPPVHFWLADIGVVRRDESVYLVPQIERECIVAAAQSGSTGGLRQYQVLPDSGFHVSFHHSGAVNLFTGERKIKVRPPTSARGAPGPVLAMVVRSTAALRPAGDTTSAKIHVLPLPGTWRSGPVGIRIDRSVVGAAEWVAPRLGEMGQVHFHLPVRGKSVQYHIVVWQHRNLDAGAGDVTISWPQAGT
jgi:hypothetical protein